MDANKIYPPKFLKAEDIPGPINATIEGVYMDTMHDVQTGEEIEKPCIDFVGIEKALVCNKTNWDMLISLFGNDTDKWAANSVRLVTVPVNAFGKVTEAIRVMPIKAPAAGQPDLNAAAPF